MVWDGVRMQALGLGGTAGFSDDGSRLAITTKDALLTVFGGSDWHGAEAIHAAANA